jgi:hypothetical protein
MRLGATSVDLVNIEELEEDEAMEQQSVEAQATQKEDIVEAGVHPLIEVQTLTKV